MKMNRERKLNGKKGQSIIEYILMIAAVITVLLVFLKQGGFFSSTYNNVITMQGDDVFHMTNDIFFDAP